VAVHELRIDRGRPLREHAGPCHTRWHPDIPPTLICRPGDEVVIDARDAIDGQLTIDSTPADVAKVDRSIVHPLTGPILIEGAEPGDVLEVEILAVEPSRFGYTAQFPGFGFLAAEYPEPFLLRWEIVGDAATSPDLEGVTIPAAPFMGTIGVAPSHDLLRRVTARERQLAAEGFAVALPHPAGAFPPDERIGREGIRTKPPRAFGGNLDIRQLTAGSRALFPVWTPGALFSAGDGHVAQGDGESCGTAIEAAATLHARFGLRKGEAAERGLRDVRIELPGPQRPIPGPRVATTGLSVDDSAAGAADDLTAAARAALRNMIDHLVAERGYTSQQAYALCSVAVDLTISQAVNTPSFLVTAWLPLGIFDGQ
jgi:formamidase